MTTHSETRTVPYTADLLYAIVADVEQYPKFLPWVTALSVTAREQVKGRDVLTARMTVGFRSFQESYTSRVILDQAGRTIDVAQTDGPFRQLENHWRFTPDAADPQRSCEVDFSIAFEFRNPVLNLVAGAAFGRVMLRTTDAFLERAKTLSRQT